MNQRPVAIGLLLCEQVIVEEKTRNVTPVNCFSHREVKDLPPDPFSFAVLATLTDGQGTVALEMVIERLDNLEDVLRRTAQVKFASPLQEIRCLFRIRNCVVPDVGHYAVKLLANGEILAQRKLIVHLPWE